MDDSELDTIELDITFDYDFFCSHFLPGEFTLEAKIILFDGINKQNVVQKNRS